MSALIQQLLWPFGQALEVDGLSPTLNEALRRHYRAHAPAMLGYAGRWGFLTGCLATLWLLAWSQPPAFLPVILGALLLAATITALSVALTFVSLWAMWRGTRAQEK